MLIKQKIKQFDIVRLIDGREGTVLEIYDFSNRPRGYDIELSEQEGEIVTVTDEQIDEVIWEKP
ncbi:hypothetical protein [Mahella australiensis]|uniref:DUF4926 domain-containing protein n=1 Tax=Mahella australiensis (strain DSM 15567 / CIP 107919 / 50-1 BON) TaxID=697281 RepID=F4A0H4_MAHA5|nr:hypothetical protein [Mahella australiensis]AEE98035.1 hypothetical protein Mahau_2913 [Mahella australiensis 50-1 BON]